MPQVEFRYLTGIRGASFTAARLRGSWNAQGRFSDNWTELAMDAFVAEDGCPAFRASVFLDPAETGGCFGGVSLSTGPQAPTCGACPPR